MDYNVQIKKKEELLVWNDVRTKFDFYLLSFTGIGKVRFLPAKIFTGIDKVRFLPAKLYRHRPNAIW